MLSLHVAEGHQTPLIHEVHADDQQLLNTIDGEWFEILPAFPWADYRYHAAAYYDVVYGFNISDGQTPVGDNATPLKTKEQARQRLLFDRAMMQAPQGPLPHILNHSNVVQFKVPEVDPLGLAPGVVPLRLVGRKSKCFFGLLKGVEKA